ncbi:MFS transporter [Streptomyces sp. NPDC047880]|uniref:MFS transporter n=1 Tax=Streptomyces sp. NPDC047880 TaxID=3155626 RepID=UPI003454CB45
MPELSHRRRMLVLAICCMSLLIVSLDNTVLNVALPSMQQDLHASTSGLQWTIDAYTLVLASLLMLAGSTADRIGRKRVFMAGLVVFTVGSVLCSLAPNLEALIAFRMVQAVGGTAVSGMPRAQAGVAAAVASTSRQLGQTLGVAVVGAVLASGVGASPYRETFVSAARPGWWILAVCGFAVLALGALTNGRWARGTAERAARRLESADMRDVRVVAGR